ncbi:membrane carboxypeptidase [Paenibacillus popilliae ATCC 14706]|uniref:Membrane carboxypeptidase n=1 Tax=Paenibacillus popilliae ATCC 14706 TaxID=1212764 RepID=M9LIB6_PAEPP|nr:membrane carboxypeptidase [Paenibacillus popilliae ATCC 14706]
MNPSRLKGTFSARVVHVLETKALRGRGTEKDPFRVVTQYWDLDGNLLAESEGPHEPDA